MPLKLVCHEFCPQCGERLHTLDGRYIRYHGACSCAPPGPPDPPRRFERSQVIFRPKELQPESTDRKAVLEKELLNIRGVCREEKEELETGVTELDAIIASIDNALLERSEESLEAGLRKIKELCLKEKEALEAGLVLQDESIASINRALGE